jgi:UDP-N-acetylmuramoylalanine--D-glutamate ligase
VTGHEEPLAGVRRALVVGLGASGLAAARALAAAGVEVTVTDDRPDHPAIARAGELGARFTSDPVRVVGDGDVDLVVPSPGVPERAPVLAAAFAAGTPVWSEPELALRRHPRRLVGITGTNGKTSVTELVTAILTEAGFEAHACGNIGPPVCDVAAASTASAVLVAELSSFQLRFVERLRPEVGVVLNLSADHLDWHADMRAYAAAKARLFSAQHAGDWAVTNAGDPATAQVAAAAPGRRAAFCGQGEVDVGVGVVDGVLTARLPVFTGPVLDVATLADDHLPPPHHVANVAAAVCAGLLIGADAGAAARAATRYRAGSHRFEVVAVDDRGVRYVNDSKATNVHAAVAALHAAGPCVWIGGGLAKGVDLTPLADALSAARAAVLIGEAADELAAVAARAGVDAHPVGSVEEAVEVAATLAGEGDAVLLAPACASFDQFASYQERGERFAAAARARAAGGPGTKERL